MPQGQLRVLGPRPCPPRAHGPPWEMEVTATGDRPPCLKDAVSGVMVQKGLAVAWLLGAKHWLSIYLRGRAGVGRLKGFLDPEHARQQGTPRLTPFSDRTHRGDSAWEIPGSPLMLPSSCYCRVFLVMLTPLLQDPYFSISRRSPKWEPEFTRWLLFL